MASGTIDPPRASLSASVLYWHAREIPLVEQCVESLVAQREPAADLHVIVVDNGSGLTPRLPDGVELLRMPRNLGFVGGHNAAMRAALVAGADFFFLVNSDVVLESDCVRSLMHTADAWPAVGVLGPLVLSARGAGTVESNGLAFNVRNGRHRELDHGRAGSDVARAPHMVDAVSGCALLARRAVLERVGLLDDRLYFYFEDMDWCLRASRAGFQIGVVPEARVWHQGSASTGAGWPGTTFYSVRNHLVVGGRYARGPLTWALPPLILTYHLAFLLRSREHRSLVHLAALIRGAFAAWTAQMGEQAGRASSH